MMVSRMKSVVNTFVSKQQLWVRAQASHRRGHSPPQVNPQAYLEGTDEEGLILALDCEKAFDRVSWGYYHQAIGAQPPPTAVHT
eukprot:scaffold4899_cov135-Isochrysis_galbana.AAC.5